MKPYPNVLTLADYIEWVNKKEREKVTGEVVQANETFVSRSGMRIPCHNRATALYYKYKEEAEKNLPNNNTK